MKYFISSCFSIFLLASTHQVPAAQPVSDRYVALALQGDLSGAGALLGEMEHSGVPAERELASRFRARFVDRTEPLSPGSGSALIDDIVRTYRAYWIGALMAGREQVSADLEREQALGTTLQNHGWPLQAGADSNALQRLLATAIEAEGYYALPAPARPLEDLLLWRRQTEARYNVELTDQVREVTVVFLSDFISQGWKHYAALGQITTSGWIENGKLYCVDSVYEPGTEAFEVSYLRHEARHLADMERFPGLPAADLEYRAKLTELAFASGTLRSLLEEFTARGVADSEAPHAAANFRVTHDVYRELYGRTFHGDGDAWMTLDATRVQQAARRLLQSDTRGRLVGAGEAGTDFP
jgi:hypothetical protein